LKTHKVQAMNSTVRDFSKTRLQQRQQGAVLVVSLIMLLVVTLVAVSSMQGTVMEEKMAGNTRDRNLAFQTTESALREAEIYIESVTNVSAFAGAGGLYGLTDDEPDYADEDTWTDADEHVVASAPHGSYDAPRYFIKSYTVASGTSGALNLSGYGDNKGVGDVTIFTVTARGTGASAESAEVILRSYYGRTF
jgi:type IV pilus assembly protein PilX